MFRFNEKYVSTGATPGMQLAPLLELDPNYSFSLEEKVLTKIRSGPVKRTVAIVVIDGDTRKPLTVPVGGVTVNYLYTKCGYDLSDYEVELCLESTGQLLLDKKKVLELTEGTVLRVAAQKRAEVGEVLVPCEFCSTKIRIADLRTHECKKAARVDNDSIPCEKCGLLIPAQGYLAHEAQCK
jgi:hypothetical protein